jgi:titin
VAAVNEAGVGPDSLASMPVTPATVPAAPAGIVAVEGDGAATLSWTPPADGGSPIAGYLVEIQPATPGATIAVSGAGATIGSLTNGIAYTFRVAATNAMGDGPWSEPSAPVTPFAPLAAGSHTIVFSFTTSGLPAAPVGGIQLAVALPAGISVSADPATGEIDTGAIHAGGAVPGANVIAGSYAASTRRVSLALASTAEAAWSGEFLRLDVTVEPGLRLGADDLLRLNAPLPAFEAVGVDTATHRTVVLTEQVQPGLALVNP